MRTAAICPTCATYENALCVLYNGEYLPTIDVQPLDSLQTALEKIDTSIAGVSGTSGTNGTNGSSGTSGVTGTSGTSGAGTVLDFLQITDDYVVQSTDQFIFFSGTAVGKTITLPLSDSSNIGRVIIIKNGGTQTVNLLSVSSQPIIFTASSTTNYSIYDAQQWGIKVISTGSGWVLYI